MSAESVTGAEDLSSTPDLSLRHSEIPNYLAGAPNAVPVQPDNDGPQSEAPRSARRPLPKNRAFSSLGYAWREGLLDAFDYVGSGAILIGKRGQVLKANVKAGHHLGSGIAVVRGRLVATESGSNNALQGLLKSMEAPCPMHGSSCAALARRGAQPLLAYSVPIDFASYLNGAVGLLLLLDPQERREPPSSLLRQVFGLTPAEARLAIELAKGLDLNEIADLHAVSVGTLRVQLKSIFAKTQTKRQAQLAVLLARLSL